VFRRAYDALRDTREVRKADVEYVRILHLAASTMETDVAQALEQLLEAGTVPTAEEVRTRVAPIHPEVPELAAGEVDLAEYDGLLAQVREVGA
jgi:hypothetical protein